MPSISVIIPTNKLSSNLQELVIQLNDFLEVSEIIIVFDGIPINKEIQFADCYEIPSSSKLNAQAFGIMKASNNWLLLMDDDNLLTSSYKIPDENYFESNVAVFGNIAFENQKAVSLISYLQYYETEVINKLNAFCWKNFRILLWAYGGHIFIQKSAWLEFYSLYNKVVRKWNSGDDMFLLKFLESQKLNYTYHKNLTCFTEYVIRWKKLFNQRIRWASKSIDLNLKLVVLGVCLISYEVIMLLIIPYLSVTLDARIIAFLLIPLFHLFLAKTPKNKRFQLLLTPYVHLVYGLLVFSVSLWNSIFKTVQYAKLRRRNS